jgi:hypothetical protein
LIEPLIWLATAIDAWVTGFWHGRSGQSDEPG